MTSNIAKNRIVIALARECLRASGSGFVNVEISKNEGTFPSVYATALDTTRQVNYLIGITGRAENMENGDWDPLFNLVRTDTDHARAKSLAAAMNKKPAFVAIALCKMDSSYAAYFGELNGMGFPRSIPMLPEDRLKYRELAPYTKNERVAEFFA